MMKILGFLTSVAWAIYALCLMIVWLVVVAGIRVFNKPAYEQLMDELYGDPYEL